MTAASNKNSNHKLPTVYVVIAVSMYEGECEYDVSFAYTNLEAAHAHLNRLVEEEMAGGGIFSDDNGDPIPDIDPKADIINDYKITDQRPEFWRAEKSEIDWLEIAVHRCPCKDKDISQETTNEN